MNRLMIGKPIILLMLSIPLATSLPLAGIASEQSPPKGLSFAVYLDGREIGTHYYRFTPADNGFELISEASYDVKFLFINAYSYRHRSEESWRDGCITAISSSTDANGEPFKVKAQLAGEGAEEGAVLETIDAKIPVTVDCLRSYAYWDKTLLQSEQLLNSQTGEVADVKLKPLGQTPLPWAKGSSGEAYVLLNPEADINLWYDSSGNWLGLQSTLENGRTLHYQRLNEDPSANNPGSGATP